MKAHNIFLVFPLAIILLAGCNNSVEKASNFPAPSVSVELSREIQSAIALAGVVSVQLNLDGGPALPMTITNNTARLELNAGQVRGEHRFYITVQYTANGSANTLLIAEAVKLSSASHVLFTAAELHTIPYDKDNSGVIEPAEQQALDADQDNQSNLAEILAGGNPNNPGPTFLSANSIQVPEKQDQPGERYAVYTAQAISPRDNATIRYTLAGGAAQDRFAIDEASGVLSFINDTSTGLTWPSYTTGGNNDYSVDINANDGRLSAQLTVTVTITDMFNLQVSIGVKSLNFSWLELAGADYYKLLENPDGVSGFSEVTGGGRIQTLTFSHTITLYRFDQPNARYMLQAYAADNTLMDSSEQLNITDALLAAVGYIKAPNADAGDRFGSVSLSADGATLAVGVSFEDSGATNTDFNGNRQDDCLNADGSTNLAPTNCATNSGAVYLFQRDRNGSNNGQWGDGDFVAFIKAPNADAGDGFGSVSLSGDGTTLAVGASSEDSGATDSGAVYVFQRDRNGSNNGQWGDGDFVAFIKAPNADAGDGFGGVSLSGDGATLAVRAYTEDSGGASTGFNGNPQDDCLNADGSANLAPTNCATDSGAVYLY